MEPYGAVAILTLLAATAPPQDQGPIPQIDPVAPPTAPAKAPLLASDGEPALPGRIPGDTPDDAREAWLALSRALRTEGSEPEPVRSFDLLFDAVLRGPERTNNVKARYAFQARTGYLRCDMERSKRTQVRGPDGDWLVEEDRKTDLRGRENEQSRREMDQWVSIARNFIALSAPQTVRLVRLRLVDELPVALPTEELGSLASGLRWLDVKSPDFCLYESIADARSEPVFRALLGLDPETSEPRLAVLHEDKGDTIVLETTLLVVIEKWKTLQDYRLPQRLLVHDVDPTRSPWTFLVRPNVDLWLIEGKLNVDLAPDHFVP